MSNVKHVGYGDGVSSLNYKQIAPLTRRQKRALKKVINSVIPDTKETQSLKKLIKKSPPPLNVK